MNAHLAVRQGVRTFIRGDEPVHALRGVDVDVAGGELVALTGPSGSGKSTLLLVLAGWETLDSGEVEISDRERTAAPADLLWSSLAVVPQALGLIDDLTAEENVLLPARLGRRPVGDVEELFAELDIAKLRHAKADELSLGEQQRVAVARALVLRPAVVLADEPSTHQDAEHGRAVFAALRAAAHAGSAVIVASHDPAALVLTDRVLAMEDGRLSAGPGPGA